MTSFRKFSACASVVLALAAAPVLGADWRVVLSSDNPGIVLPQLPAPATDDYAIEDARLSDRTAPWIGFALTRGANPGEQWAEKGGQLVRIARTNAADATGPGRTGAESGHVFLQIQGDHDAGGTGNHRLFTAVAGAPGSSGNEQAIWRWDGTRNIEIARNEAGADSALGPGIGPGWSFYRLTPFGSFRSADMRALPNGEAVLNAQVQGTGAGSQRDAIIRYRPGAGNAPCFLTGDLGPDWSPGVAGIGAFDSGPGADMLAVTPRAEIYGYASTRGTGAAGSARGGIWRFCDGAPQVLALTGESGALGPGLASATFGGIYALLATGRAGEVLFTGQGQSDAGAFFGLFRHVDGANAPILLRGVESGARGPKIPGYAFQSGDIRYQVRAAGRYGVVKTSVALVANPSQTVTGLWRITPDEGATPIALYGDTGAYAPAPGRTWQSFYRFAVFENGDVVVYGEISNPLEHAVWRLRPGVAPERILGQGTLVDVPTASGIAHVPVSIVYSTTTENVASPGDDDRFNASGYMLQNNVELQGYSGGVLLRGNAMYLDRIFANGYD